MENVKIVMLVALNVQDLLIMIVLNVMLVEYYINTNVSQHAQMELLKMQVEDVFLAEQNV